jgi:glycosyltransferase involved in cell wall biosynthesis
MVPPVENSMIRRRVLLISPVREHDPPNGDVVYTEELLRHPPPGVEYETYPNAKAAGRLFELARREDFERSRGLRRVRVLGTIARERGINVMRRHGLLFSEPFRYFAVEPGAYDLVHCHVFSAAFPNLDVPLVMSGGCVIEGRYRGVLDWSEKHVCIASRIDDALARRLRVQHTSHGMPAASAVVCWTETMRRELFRRGSAKSELLHVAPCFVERGERRPARSHPNRIGFVASDFEMKGGPCLLDAFEIVRRNRPDAQLTIIGSEPRGNPSELRRAGIEWHGRVPRSEVLGRHVPTFDVCAHPTNADSLPLSVLEVMARGIPVVTSDYEAMPEIVGYGEAGSVTPQGDAVSLADALLRFLDPGENAAARVRVARWFDAHYAPDVAVAQLASAYESAAESWGGVARG